jgi:hypothetical protein
VVQPPPGKSRAWHKDEFLNQNAIIAGKTPARKKELHFCIFAFLHSCIFAFLHS